jgi:hypothetical protein
MNPIPLALLLLFVAPQQPLHQQPEPELQRRAAEVREDTRQAAIHINDLADNIHSEADAQAFVDAVAERFTSDQFQSWMTRAIRQRVAHAEYQAVSNPAQSIPEQHVVDVWNTYVRELDASEETLATVAEIHNLRDGMYTATQSVWKKGGQQLWTIPGIYAVGADGKVAGGCRAVEALKIFHDLSFSFQNLQGARERVQKGILASDSIRQRDKNSAPRPQQVRGELRATRDANPVRLAEIRYVQAHGELDYQRLLSRLFEALFPE